MTNIPVFVLWVQRFDDVLESLLNMSLVDTYTVETLQFGLCNNQIISVLFKLSLVTRWRIFNFFYNVLYFTLT